MKKLFFKWLLTSTLTIFGAQTSAQNWSENYLMRSNLTTVYQQTNFKGNQPSIANSASNTYFEGLNQSKEKKQIKHSKLGFEVGMVNYRRIEIDRTLGAYQNLKPGSNFFPYVGIFYNVAPKLQLSASLESVLMGTGITAKINSGMGLENWYYLYRSMSYLKVPIRIHYTFHTSQDNRWKFAAGTGITALIRDQNSFGGSDIFMGENVKGVTQTIEPNFQKVKHGVAIPLSLQVKFANKYGNDMFVLDLTYHQGLLPLYKASLITTYDNEFGKTVITNNIINRGSFLDVKLGYRFQFRKFN